MNSIVKLLVCVIPDYFFVIPGHEQGSMQPWIPVFTGMTVRGGNDGEARE